MPSELKLFIKKSPKKLFGSSVRLPQRQICPCGRSSPSPTSAAGTRSPPSEEQPQSPPPPVILAPAESRHGPAMIQAGRLAWPDRVGPCGSGWGELCRGCSKTGDLSSRLGLGGGGGGWDQGWVELGEMD